MLKKLRKVGSAIVDGAEKMKDSVVDGIDDIREEGKMENALEAVPFLQEKMRLDGKCPCCNKIHTGE